jgi:hypothetical protein
MNIKKILVVFPLLIMFLGCSNNYQVMMNNWVGIEEVDLVRGWGEPDKTYSEGDSKYFAYHEDGGSPNGCTTTFELIKGIVDSFEYEGESCVGDFYTHTRRR